METWMWIVVAVLVVAIIVALAVAISRRNAEHQVLRRRDEAAHLRTMGEEQELTAKERAADAAAREAQAHRARMEAERLEREARVRAGEAQASRAEAQTHLRRADHVDPDVRDDAAGRFGPSRDPRTAD